MKKIFDGVMSAPKDNVVIGADVKHLESTTNKNWLASNCLTDKVAIVGNLLQGAINLVNGNTSIAAINDEEDEVYFEFKMANNDKIFAILKDDGMTYTCKYAGNYDLDESPESWPLGAIITYICFDNETRKNGEFHQIMADLRDESQNIVSKETSFKFISYVLSKITSKKSGNRINIDMPEKVRKVNEKDGEIIKVERDLTPEFSKIPGIFDGINSVTIDTTSSTGFVSKIGTGAYDFGLRNTLTEAEKALIPTIGPNEPVNRLAEMCIFQVGKDLHGMMYLNFGMYGRSGSGKSQTSKQVASEFGLPYSSFALHEDFCAALGHFGINSNGETFFEKDALAKAIERPGVIEFAEFNAAFATRLTKLYDLIDPHKGVTILEDGSILRRHKDCVFIFTCNVGYKALNDTAQSLPARFLANVELERPNRSDLKKICLAQLYGRQIDEDIVENVLDFYEEVEQYLEVGSINGTLIPKSCENSLRGYAYFMTVLQSQRENGYYNPLIAAGNTILPMITASADYNKNLMEEFLNVVATTFEFFE